MMNRLCFGLLMFCFLFVLSSKQADAQCTHTFNMYDSYGDGWNGASVNVLVNGSVVVSGATIGWGSFASAAFSANNGDAISLGNWVSGSWNSEISWDIKDGNGTVIASGVYGGLPNATANCGSSSPCSAGEISVTLNMYDSYGDGWNGNTWTASSTTNSSISYGPFTLSSGSSGSTTFCMSEDCYAIVCNYGSWQSEVSWQLVNNATGGIIASGGAPFSQSQIVVGSGSCSSPPPSPSFFCDDFESYANGSYLAASSPNWTTWTSPYTASEDVQITNTLSNSPSNSIYFNGTSSPGGPSDVILPFGSSAPYTSGYFNFSAEFYVINGAYFNFQTEVATNIGWAFEAEMSTSGVINFTHWNGSNSSTLLNVNYPTNQWFELRMEIDLNSNSWAVFINGVLQGSFFNPNNQIASLDLYPLAG
ncbi:hypothetical protein OAJ65_03615, partial [Flavobacteriales bacterium]|nr:hypothetical protein [Flavobacteriales bacterium]